MKLSRSNSDEWWSTAFGPDYLLTYADVRTLADTELEVEFISKLIPPGSRLLDVACGYGRHALALARRGYRVVGVDRSDYLISVARKDAADCPRGPDYVIGDMRYLPFGPSFDAALSMFTSFGYFRTHSENQLALQSVSRVLVGGGKFLLDLSNPAAIARFIKSKGGRPLRDGSIMQCRYVSHISNGLKLNIAERLNQKTLLWSGTCSWSNGHAERGYESRVRLYSFDDVKKMLLAQGLSVVSVWGAFDGTKFDPDLSPRLIVLAEKG